MRISVWLMRLYASLSFSLLLMHLSTQSHYSFHLYASKITLLLIFTPIPYPEITKFLKKKIIRISRENNLCSRFCWTQMNSHLCSKKIVIFHLANVNWEIRNGALQIAIKYFICLVASLLQPCWSLFSSSFYAIWWPPLVERCGKQRKATETAAFFV